MKNDKDTLASVIASKAKQSHTEGLPRRSAPRNDDPRWLALFWDVLQTPDAVDYITCEDCACIDCARFSGCDIRDKCEECRPMTLLYCSERIYAPAILRPKDLESPEFAALAAQLPPSKKISIFSIPMGSTLQPYQKAWLRRKP